MTVFMVMVFWRPQEWLVPALYGWPVLDVVVGIAVFALYSDVQEGRLRVPKDLPQLGLLIGLWLSAPLSHVPHTYVLGFVNSIMPVFTVCFFTYLLICVLDRPLRLRVMAVLFVCTGITFAIHAFLQESRGYGFGYCRPYWVEASATKPEHWRTCFFGIFNDPNDFGQLFVICMPFAFAMWRRLNIFTFGIASAIVYMLFKAMLTTYSRGAQVGLIAMIGTQFILWLPRKWFPYLLGLGLIGFLGICPFAGPYLDQSAHDRVIYWGLANQMFKHNFLFGIGYDMGWQVTARGEALHNCFVVCYTEIGLIGYWFWFLLIYLGILGAWRARNAMHRAVNPEARWARRFAGLTIVSMVGFCASGYFLARTFVFPLFFLMAMLAVVPRLARQYLPPQQVVWFDRRKDLYLLGTFSTLLSVVYIYISCILLNMAFYGG